MEVSKKVQEFLESIFFKYPVTSNFLIEWNSIFSFFFFFWRLEINERFREKIERKKLLTFGATDRSSENRGRDWILIEKSTCW